MVTTFFPPHIGGVEYHVLNLSKYLASRDHEITILTSLLPDARLESREMLNDGIEIVRIKNHFLRGWPYDSLSSVGITNAEKIIMKLVKEKDITVVHAHGHHYPLTWNAISTAHKLNLPSVLTLHGMYALNPTKTFARTLEEIFNLTFLRLMLRRATAVIGLTQTIAQYGRRYDPERKYYIIPNGVDIKKFLEARRHREAYRQKYQMPEKVVFLFLGRFASVKGVLELAEAAKFFEQNGNETFFLFVGGGPLHERLKKTLKSVKTSSKIIGWVPNAQVHELYIASDVYVLPSKWEALPITLIEAMASGLPIVATRVGGILDILAGYSSKTYIDGFSSTSIIEALQHTLFSIGEKANSNPDADIDYIKGFSWDCITQKTEEVYLNVNKNVH